MIIVIANHRYHHQHRHDHRHHQSSISSSTSSWSLSSPIIEIIIVMIIVITNNRYHHQHRHDHHLHQLLISSSSSTSSWSSSSPINIIDIIINIVMIIVITIVIMIRHYYHCRYIHHYHYRYLFISRNVRQKIRKKLKVSNNYWAQEFRNLWKRFSFLRSFIIIPKFSSRVVTFLLHLVTGCGASHRRSEGGGFESLLGTQIFFWKKIARRTTS